MQFANLRIRSVRRIVILGKRSRRLLDNRRTPISIAHSRIFDAHSWQLI